VRRRGTPIIGSAVREQSTLRPPKPARDLDEFLEFLRRLRVLFRPAARRRPRTTGEHFRL
jgi:hypothetical protein